MGGALASGTNGPISEGCVNAVATSFCVETESFDDNVDSFTTPSDTLQTVLAALLIVSDPVESTLSDTPIDLAPELLKAALFDASQAADETGGADFSQVSALEFSSVIHRIQYDPMIDGLASNRGGVLSIGSILPATYGADDQGSPEVSADFAIVYPFFVSVALMHEMGHEYYGGHVSCDAGAATCDETREGAYGVGAWWAYAWLSSSPEGLSQAGCEDAADAGYHYNCAQILDDPAWLACEDGAMAALCP